MANILECDYKAGSLRDLADKLQKFANQPSGEGNPEAQVSMPDGRKVKLYLDRNDSKESIYESLTSIFADAEKAAAKAKVAEVKAKPEVKAAAFDPKKKDESKDDELKDKPKDNTTHKYG